MVSDRDVFFYSTILSRYRRENYRSVYNSATNGQNRPIYSNEPCEMNQLNQYVHTRLKLCRKVQ